MQSATKKQRVEILGVPIDVLSPASAVEHIREMLTSETRQMVATPNNEILLKTIKDSGFRKILQKSDLNLADSTGVALASFMTGQGKVERVTGVDTVRAVCSRQISDIRVFLLGAAEGVAQRAAEKLQQASPDLNIVGTYAGSPAEEEAEDIVQLINEASPHLLLVAYGAPAQDLWIAKYLSEMPSVRVAMGVGGTFDFLAGNVRRAPSLLRAMGLEWLWRLMLQPKRIGRIWNAVVVFPLLILKSKLSH